MSDDDTISGSDYFKLSKRGAEAVRLYAKFNGLRSYKTALSSMLTRYHTAAKKAESKGRKIVIRYEEVEADKPGKAQVHYGLPGQSF